MSVAVVVLVAMLVAAGFGWRALSRYPRRSKHGRVDDGDGPFIFPAGFLWGAATADQQIENQQPSDWTELENRAREGHLSAVGVEGRALPGHIKGIRDVSEEVLRKKSDFDRLYAEDLRRAASMGHNAHRFSMSWARLFPREDMTTPDGAGIDFYGRILDEMKRCGLVPFVTLHHFANPAWLSREHNGKIGVEREDAVERFAQFTDAVVAAYGDRVRFWCTLNEPMVYAYQGYLDGTFPPNQRRKSPREVLPVIEALLRMHAAAYRVIHDDATRRKTVASVGIAQHVRSFMPWRDTSPLDRITAGFIDQSFVLAFLDALHTGTLVMPQAGVVEHIGGLAQDYVGVNFYGRAYVKTNLRDPMRFDIRFHDPQEPGDEASDLGWTGDEAALTTTLERFHKRYQKPLYILENGLADNHDDDVRRQRFLVRHTQAIWRAVQHKGADVRGYFHWSLVDNFEWAEGFGPRFGLFAVDYEKEFARRPRGTVDVYKQIASQNAVPAELWRRHRR